MNKGKIIEEMAQNIAQVIDDVHAGCRLTDCEDCRYFENDLEMCKAYAIAERLEALDYIKQVQGEWKPVMQELNYYDTCKCSVCEFEIDISQTDYKYCPNCSAKMKGAEQTI